MIKEITDVPSTSRAHESDPHATADQPEHRGEKLSVRHTQSFPGKRLSGLTLIKKSMSTEEATFSSVTQSHSNPTTSAMYATDGTLNVFVLQDVLSGVRTAFLKLGKPTSAKSAVIRQISKIVSGGVKDQNLYRSLKDLSVAIKNERTTRELECLASLVLQMARTHNFIRMSATYDAAGVTSTKMHLKTNPLLDVRPNASISTVISLAAGAGVALGASIGLVDPASLQVGLTVDGSKTNTLSTDVDYDAVLVTLRKSGASATVSANVGHIPSVGEVAKFEATTGLRHTYGRLLDAQDTKGVLSYKAMFEREGGRGFSPYIQLQKGAVAKLTNVRTRRKTPLGREHRDSEFNTFKIGKGGDPCSFFVGGSSLVKNIPECTELQKILDRAYGTFQFTIPESLNTPITVDGVWHDVQGEVRGEASLLRLGLAGYGEVEGAGASIAASLNKRWLPYRLWSANHKSLDRVSGGNTEHKRDLINQIKEVDRSVARYLTNLEGTQGAEQLARELDVFEKNSQTLLSMRSVIAAKKSFPVLKEHAQNVSEEALNRLRRVFALEECEYKDIGPGSERLEKLIARCWNRLSLGYSQVELLASEDDKAVLEHIGNRIERPQILMAPTHLYHASSIQFVVRPERLRTQSSFTLKLPALSLGTNSTATLTSASAGSLTGTVYRDTVSKHSNILRNGDFITINVSSVHLPGLAVMDKVATAIARCLLKHLQPGTDDMQFAAAEYAALTASISSTLLSGSINPGGASIDASAGISRQFDLVLHRSAKDESWRVSYFQSGNSHAQTLGLGGRGTVTAGVGISLTGKAGIARTSLIVRPQILGSCPATHILQEPAVKAALFNERGAFCSEKSTLDRLRGSDFSISFLSNNAILDNLELMKNVKSSRNAKADIFGKLVRLDYNSQQYVDFKTSGAKPDELGKMIDTARQKTLRSTAEDRLRYFTTDNTGRALLREYAQGIDRFAEMKRRASFQHAPTEDQGYHAIIVTATGEKHDLKLPTPLKVRAARTGSTDSRFSRRDRSRQAIRRFQKRGPSVI